MTVRTCVALLRVTEASAVPRLKLGVVSLMFHELAALPALTTTLWGPPTSGKAPSAAFIVAALASQASAVVSFAPAVLTFST